MKNHKKTTSGQVLLIVILISLVLLTIGLSITQQNIDETRLTKLEEENKKALSAAEAGIEALLRDTTGTTSIAIGEGTSILSDAEGVQGKAVLQEGLSNILTTSLLRKDDTLTAYLIPQDQIGTSNTNSSGFTIAHDLSTCSSNPDHKFALELTFLNGSDSGSISTTRYFDCGSVITGSDLWDNTTPASQALLIHLVTPSSSFPGVRLTLNRAVGDNWPLQGKTIVSSVTTNTGVVKTIQLFQSYPQIPGDFQMTKF
jgi:hypothetical protein